ncbi:MAG: DUF547 domain-containing protein, partial [Alphaproteobacteria bacterium]
MPQCRQLTRRVAGFAAALAMLWPLSALAAPKAELWQRWTAHDPAATATIDHSAWERFVKAYVAPQADGVNRVPYGRIGVAGRNALDDYIAALAATPISTYGRAEQLAYWINLYNALTVRVVLDHYPVKSILDIRISPGWFAIGPWGKKVVTVEGEALSLDDIEHRILRPIWRDARIHYAVNCASIGCPNLRAEAFTGSGAEALLSQAAVDYVNHPRGAEVRGGRLVVSSIYAWYKEDFGDSDAGVIDHL